VQVDVDGYLHPIKDGETRITVFRLRALTAVLPVTVPQPRGASPGSPLCATWSPSLTKSVALPGTGHGASQRKIERIQTFAPRLRPGSTITTAWWHDVSGRRFNRADPARSLMLLKPTAQVPHGGGMRFDLGSQYYKTIFAWLAEGVPYGDPKARACGAPGG